MNEKQQKNKNNKKKQKNKKTEKNRPALTTNKQTAQQQETKQHGTAPTAITPFTQTHSRAGLFTAFVQSLRPSAPIPAH